KHDGCTEAFYKDQVEEDMRARQVDDQVKLEMQRLVRRYHEQPDDQIDDYEGDNSDEEQDKEADLAERLDGIDLNDSSASEAIWSRLTENERMDFLRLIDSQEVDELIQPWVPCLAYVHMMRHFNGDPHGSNGPAAFNDVIVASPLVASKVADVFESTHEALVTGLYNIGQDEMLCKTKCALLDDIQAIYSRSEFVVAMMSDLCGL
ncbi:Zinc finger HIT domain-containing protein 2, partial [Coemansia thaxteri]